MDDRQVNGRLFRDVVSTIRQPLLVLNERMGVLTANNRFYQVFQVTPDETVGRSLYALGNGQWDIPRLKELLEVILPTQNPRGSWWNTTSRPSGTR
jgi:two-component system CheB/CheR fusion protein